MDKKERRVVITGLGVISSIGIGKDEFWSNLIKGKSGISKIESFDTSEYDRHYGGEIKNFRAEEFIDRRRIKAMGRASQLAIAASRLALEDAGLKLKDIPKEKTGVCVGTTMGEAQVMEKMDEAWTKRGDKGIDFKLIPQYPSNAITLNISLEFKIKGR